MFLDDKSGDKWCLFSSWNEALELVADWKKDPKYSEQVDSEMKANIYFKNRVDNFERQVHVVFGPFASDVKPKSRKHTARKKGR